MRRFILPMNHEITYTLLRTQIAASCCDHVSLDVKCLFGAGRKVSMQYNEKCQEKTPDTLMVNLEDKQCFL